VETAVTTSQASSDHDEESGGEQVKEKTKKASTLMVPGKKTKAKVLKSPKKRKKASKAKEGVKESEKGGDEGKEEGVVEEGDKQQTEPPTKTEKKGFEMKRGLVVGECREEKAAYVKVREARMVTLADKVSNHGHNFCTCVIISRRQYNMLEVTYLA